MTFLCCLKPILHFIELGELMANYRMVFDFDTPYHMRKGRTNRCLLALRQD